MRPTLSAGRDEFPIAGTFNISRESRTVCRVVTATIENRDTRGWGECLPYPHYGESVDGVTAEIEAMAAAVTNGLDRKALLTAMKPGAARNAIDCALLDYEAKRTGVPVAERLGIALAPLTTAVTIGIDSAEAMAAKAAELAAPVLKVKLGRGERDAERIAAVRAAAPDSTLLLDANEGWRADNLPALLAAAADAGAAMVEQPLPAGADALLAEIDRPVPICADESAHGIDDLGRLKTRYDVVSVKLDKAGGLTAALALTDAARAEGFQVLVSCMLATSLAMAPAAYVAQRADFVDLDGPLLLARDRTPGIRYEGTTLHPPPRVLWG